MIEFITSLILTLLAAVFAFMAFALAESARKDRNR
jgi:hypothetical protein